MKLTSMVWRWCHEGGVITDTDMLDNTIAGFRALAPAGALEFYHLMATDAPVVARHALEWHTATLRSGDITVLIKARYNDKATRKKVGKKAKSAGGQKIGV